MTEQDKRLERLAELARKAWPELEVAGIVTGDVSAAVYRADDKAALPAMVLSHPRALDALEAALLVLAGESAEDDMLTSLQRWWERHALALRMTSASNHKAIGVAISGLEQRKPFPTMQVLCEPIEEPSAAEAGLRWASKPTRPGWYWVRAADYADPPWLWEVTVRGDDNVLGYLDTYGGWSPCGDDCEWAGPLMLPTESEEEISAESADVELQKLRAGIEALSRECEGDGCDSQVMARELRRLLESKP